MTDMAEVRVEELTGPALREANPLGEFVDWDIRDDGADRSTVALLYREMLTAAPPAGRSEAEVKAEALDELADWINAYVGEAYDEAGQERPMLSAITSRHVRTRAARLRGEGSESE